MEITETIRKDMVFLNQDIASSDELFEFIVEKAQEHGLVKDSYVQALKDREAQFPTGLQLEKVGVAIPHADAEHLNEEFIALVTLDSPVEFHSMEDPSKTVAADIVFALGLTKSEDQLETLQTIVQIIQDDNKISNLLEAKDVDEALNALK
ncbi:PTS sugar transporter subunit IIA [Aerococcus urinae]|uniref:PTS sugar transporter subunit IIA n=1 Tax=Aerococcus urinae TaxID=1376 RepID=UPI0018A79CC1|nr:PTS sugar transporter subunit IIA [Aerococcus urinae]